MSIYNEAIRRARDEGRVDFQQMPWEQSSKQPETSRDKKTHDFRIPNILRALPPKVFTDFQIILENTHSILMEKPYRVIGVTSPTPFQGVSTCSAVMSAMLAMGKRDGYAQLPPAEAIDEWLDMVKMTEAGTKVMLLDAQIKNPVQHEYFELPEHQGLIQIITGIIPYEKLIKDTDIPTLKVIPLGEKKQFQFAPSFLENFHVLLDNLKSQFQYIIMDIPPILNFAEGLALSKLCDGIILVVRAGEIRWEVIQEAKRLLQKAGVPILGGILNQRKYFIPNWLYKRM